jgi:hypothetical protein
METSFSENYWQSIFNLRKKIVFNAGAEAVIEYADPKNNFVPEMQLLFSPFGLPFVPIEIIGSSTNKIITSLQWTKDRDNPGGMLNVIFSPDPTAVKEMVDIINLMTGNLYSMIWGELGVEIEDLFKPMTLCQLWINGYHVMTGIVRSCHRIVSVSNDGKSVSYSLSCEELGNIYNMSTASLDTIYKDAMQETIKDSLKIAQSETGTIKGMSISQGFQILVNAFKVGTLQQGISCSDGFPLALRLLATGNPIGGIASLAFGNFMTVDSNFFKLNSSGGSVQTLWNFLKNYIPSPWMELFTESGGRTIVTDVLGPPATLFPGFNYIVSRSVPYTNPVLGMINPRWIPQVLAYDLNAVSMLIGGDFIIITDDMIQDKNLGFDSINQKTVFHTQLASKAASSGGTSVHDRSIKSIGPMNPLASGGISTFGVREMWQSIDNCSLQGLGRTSSNSEKLGRAMGLPGTIIPTPALSNLLCVWFRNQSRFREGSVTIKGMAYARAGMYCLYLPESSGKKKVENLRDIGIYYISSLDHNYSLSNDSVEFTTTLNLIRGVPLPTTLAQTALLLFDFEQIPPAVGIADGEYALAEGIRNARRGIPI